MEEEVTFLRILDYLKVVLFSNLLNMAQIFYLLSFLYAKHPLGSDMEWFQNQHKYCFHASINGIQPLCQESHLERPPSVKYIDFLYQSNTVSTGKSLISF
jgi:hypothetical protein